MSLVLDLEDPAAADVAACGGKGASLARLRQGGFNVPAAVVVTAEAYRAFVASDPGLRAAAAALDVGSPEALREQCIAIRRRLTSLPLPDALRRELAARLPALLGRGPVSVRSSATLEDLAGAAFAGQHDTYLNVSGADAVADAIRRCFASLWEDRAVRYRHERGFGHLEAAMAVVVQRMVAGDVAGVAFCLHPVTGDLGQVVINAAWGLGETVVSGDGEIDQFVVDKGTGRVVESVIGVKTHALVGGRGGTRKVEVEADRRRRPCLDATAAAALAKLCAGVERFYAFPQDVEWALADGTLHLLQSRPVTRFPERWTRDESAERFPNVVTPLTWDFARDGFHESLAHSLGMLGLPPLEGRWFDRFDDHIYGNQTVVQLFTSGHAVAFDGLDDLRRKIPVLRDRYVWVQQLPVAWARDLDGYLLALGALGAVRLADLSEAALWAHVLEVDRVGREYFRPNIAISITHGLLHRMLFQLLRATAGAEAPALYDALVCYCETKTSLVNRDLHGLAASARRDPALARLLAEVDRRAIWEEGRLRAFPAFDVAFAKFLRDHGHREVDWDAYHAPWAGQPWVVLENLRLLLRQPDAENPAARERALRLRQDEAERRYGAAVPEDLRFFASELVRLARVYTALDDLEHYQTTRLLIPFRAALVECGRRLAGRGVLEAAEDVFFLHKETLAAAIRGGSPRSEVQSPQSRGKKPASTLDPGLRTLDSVAAEARRNKASYIEHRDRRPPWVWGEPAPQQTLRDAAGQAGGKTLRGIPGSPGAAEGVVCRVLGVEDFARFPRGAVLVARTTNPAWTPLFYTACAVVTESGGPLSHGAVTAREVGLPAVMAVRDALTALPEGAKVRVDGSKGTVTRVDR